MKTGVVWIAAIIVFACIEAVSYHIVSVWFAVGAAMALIAMLCGFGVAVQLTVFSAVSLVCILFTRPLFKKLLENRIEKTNVDALIGRAALVTEDIDNIEAKGCVRINGIEWTARSSDDAVIGAGKKVRVDGIDGVKLIVKDWEE